MADDRELSKGGCGNLAALAPSEDRGKSLGRLARRISSWTTNGLLTVMLLVVAVGSGREIVHWWHGGAVERPGGSSPVETVVSGPEGQLLQFGNLSWSIRRQEYSGPREAVPDALQAACRDSIATAQPASAAPDAAESEVLSRLSGERAVAESPGQWRLYQWSGGFPILIGTRAFSAESPRPVGLEAGANLAQTSYRVVVWGIAVPVASNDWTLYVFQAGGLAAGPKAAAVEIPLPPGTRRLASIRTAAGEAVTAFSLGGEGPGRVQAFFDRWFAEHDWVAAAPWRRTAAGWHARFEPRAGGATRNADIRLGLDSQGLWSGLLMETQTERGRR